MFTHPHTRRLPGQRSRRLKTIKRAEVEIFVFARGQVTTDLIVVEDWGGDGDDDDGLACGEMCSSLSPAMVYIHQKLQ